MSFKTQKVLICGLCQELVAVKDNNFPEDLHALLAKYCIPQLYWICTSCEKQSNFKNSFEKNSNIENDVISLKTRVENLEIELAEIKKLVNHKVGRDYASGVFNSFEISGELTTEKGSPNKEGSSCLNFQKKLSSHQSLSGDSYGVDSCSPPEPNNSQGVNSCNTLVDEDYQRSSKSSFNNFQEMKRCLPSVFPINQDSSNSSLELNEASPKKKKEALALIHEISNTKIKIDDKESAKSSNIVDIFLKSITKFLKKDMVFNNLYSRDYRTGSSYNDLRISAASEYDVDIVFKATPEVNLEVEFFKETLAYAKIKWQKLGETPTNKLDLIKFFEKISKDGYLEPLKISAWFQGLIDLFLQSNAEITGIKKIRNLQSGPARTIELVTDEDYVLHIDLVPVFVFSYDIVKTTMINGILEKYSVDKSKMFWFLVPKQCQGEGQLLASDCKLSWRVDFPEVEKKVLHNKQSAKHIIRLLKLLRDINRWNIASYYIKTLILWKVDNFPDSVYWQGNMLFERFLETMKFLQECAKNQHLPFFMDPSYNLFHALNKDESKNLSNRLQRIISLIETDHNNLNNIYS